MGQNVARAVERGDVDTVQKAIDKDPQIVFTTDDRGFSLLHMAADRGKIEIVKLLLEEIANAELDIEENSRVENKMIKDLEKYRPENSKSEAYASSKHSNGEKDDFDGIDDVERPSVLFSPLHCASKNGHNDVVQLFLESQVDVNIIDNLGCSSLHYASEKGHMEVFKTLMDFYADMDVQDKMGRTPLHLAAIHNRVDISQALIDVDAELDLQDENGYTPIHHASEKGHTSIAKILIDSSANLNIQEENGFIPLHNAAGNGHVNIVRMLLKACPWKNKATCHYAPLHIAVAHHHVAVVKLLMETKPKPDVDVKDKYGTTPVQIAIRGGNAEITYLLIRHGANVDYLAQAALSLACKANHIDMNTHLLRNYELELDDTDDNGRTPLHWAAMNGHMEIIQELMDRHPDINVKDYDDNTPISLARQVGHLKVVEYIKSRVSDYDESKHLNHPPANPHPNKKPATKPVRSSSLLCPVDEEKALNDDPRKLMKKLVKSQTRDEAGLRKERESKGHTRSISAPTKKQSVQSSSRHGGHGGHSRSHNNKKNKSNRFSFFKQINPFKKHQKNKNSSKKKDKNQSNGHDDENR